MSTLVPLIRKLEQFKPLHPAEREAIESWRFRIIEIAAHSDIAREGIIAEESAVLLHGYAFRQKVLEGGSRQIVALHIPGDFIDLHSLVLKPLDHSITASTRTVIAKIPHGEIFQTMEKYPNLARTFMWDIALDGAVTRQWMVTMGQKSAYEQLAHLMCELYFRLERVGLAQNQTFELMLTQTDFADICGITPIHVNRSLQALQRDGLVIREKKQVTLPDIESLIETAGFDPSYLHLLAASAKLD